MSGCIYGYIRVSTKNQNEARQIMAMRKFGVPDGNLFLDKKSGKDFERPAYRRLLKKLRPEDTMVIKSIDRLGRNYDEVIDQWRFITKTKKAIIMVLDLPLMNKLQTCGSVGRLIADLVLDIMSYFAQTEREFIHQRQAEGIAAAKLRGVKFGREPKKRPAIFESLRAAWEEKRLSAREAARRLAIDPHTFTRWATDERDS